MDKYEYSFVPDDVNIYLRDEAIDFAEVWANSLREAINIAWKNVPDNCTVLNVRKEI